MNTTKPITDITKKYLLIDVENVRTSSSNNTQYYTCKFLDTETKGYVFAYPTHRTKNFKFWSSIITNNTLGMYDNIVMWNLSTIDTSSKPQLLREFTQAEIDEYLGKKPKKKPVVTVFNHPLFTVHQ